MIPLNTDKISDYDRVCPDLLFNTLRTKLPLTPTDITCSITFTGFRFHKKSDRVFTVYGFCKQPECKLQFKFRGNVSDTSVYTKIEIFVMESALKDPPNHTLPIAYQLRGREREKG